MRGSELIRRSSVLVRQIIRSFFPRPFRFQPADVYFASFVIAIRQIIHPFIEVRSSASGRQIIRSYVRPSKLAGFSSFFFSLFSSLFAGLLTSGLNTEVKPFDILSGNLLFVFGSLRVEKGRALPRWLFGELKRDGSGQDFTPGLVHRLL